MLVGVALSTVLAGSQSGNVRTRKGVATVRFTENMPGRPFARFRASSPTCGVPHRERLTRMTTHLKPPGLFALSSADRLEDMFLRALRDVFVCLEAQDVRFYNHHLGGHDSNRVVIPRLSDKSGDHRVPK